MLKTISYRSLILLFIIFLSSCARYQKQWDKVRIETKEPHSGILGAWTGTWKSIPSGHNGKLKCIIKEKDDNVYEFYYWATWAKVLSGGFRTSCEVTKENALWTFEGTQNLGALGGKFSHKGNATSKKIEATYKAEHGDHGIFTLTRP